MSLRTRWNRLLRALMLSEHTSWRAVLGVTQDASLVTVRNVYKLRISQGPPERMAEICAAWEAAQKELVKV